MSTFLRSVPQYKWLRYTQCDSADAYATCAGIGAISDRGRLWYYSDTRTSSGFRPANLPWECPQPSSLRIRTFRLPFSRTQRGRFRSLILFPRARAVSSPSGRTLVTTGCISVTGRSLSLWVSRKNNRTCPRAPQSGGEFTPNLVTPPDLDIAPLVGYIVTQPQDGSEPIITRVDSPQRTESLTPASMTRILTWWLMDSTGAVIQQGMAPDTGSDPEFPDLGIDGLRRGHFLGIRPDATPVAKSTAEPAYRPDDWTRAVQHGREPGNPRSRNAVDQQDCRDDFSPGRSTSFRTPTTRIFLTSPRRLPLPSSTTHRLRSRTVLRPPLSTRGTTTSAG